MKVTNIPGVREKISIHRFDKNIGHLARGGCDGWGRAFCYGLNAAISGGYEYVTHIEGDSLFRPPVQPILDDMNRNSIKVMSIPVNGTKRKEENWIETGLMFFDVDYLVESKFVDKYDWPHGEYKKYPYTPEYFVHKIIKDNLTIASWNGLRNDTNKITVENLEQNEVDWITHAEPEIYDKFISLFKN